MRVSKIVREYIEKEVSKKANGDQVGFICYKNSNNEESVHDMVKLSARFLANMCES